MTIDEEFNLEQVIVDLRKTKISEGESITMKSIYKYLSYSSSEYSEQMKHFTETEYKKAFKNATKKLMADREKEAEMEKEEDKMRQEELRMQKKLIKQNFIEELSNGDDEREERERPKEDKRLMKERKEKLKSLNRPIGLPPLYPGPPAWLTDKSRFPNELNSMKNFIYYFDSGQHENDHRWAYLCQLYDNLGEKNVKLPIRKHLETFREAGWDLQVKFNTDMNKQVDFGELMNNYQASLQLLSNYKLPVEIINRKCDVCGKLTQRQCRCGEAYCSRDCQIKDWKDHRKQCLLISENNQLAEKVTEVYWAKEAQNNPQLFEDLL